MKIVVAFSSPKRSANTVDAAAKHAKAVDAELILLRIIPDPEKVGVVAQLISSERPVDTAQRQIDEVVARLKEQGDEAGRRILERILDDEIRHVGLGSKHFFALCERRGEEPENHWKTLVIRHFRGSIKPPFNDSARLSAGLSRSLYAGIAL